MTPHQAEWQEVRLKDVCDRITVGHVGSMRNEYVESGVPFLRSQNVHPFHLDLASVKYISQAFHQRLRKSALAPGDVVVVRTGYPGTACVIPPSLSEANCADMVVITPGAELDGRYLAAVFNSTWGQGHVEGVLVGVAQQHFNVGAAKEMTVRLPPIEDQSRIADILSAYDDLIENNTRRIAILEEMARAIYREWFVEFRFPGHEQVEMVDSELGPVPEGWEVTPLSDAMEFRSGKTIKKAEREGGTTPVFGANGLIGFTEKGKLFQPCTVLGKIGSCGSLHRAEQPCWISNNAFGVFTGKIRSSELVWHTLSHIDFSPYIGGSANPYMPERAFGHHPAPVPPTMVQEEFHTISRPLSALQWHLRSISENLRQTRDLLLPKLISGEIDVSEAEEELEAAAV